MAIRKSAKSATLNLYEPKEVGRRPVRARLETKSNPLVQAVSQKMRLIANQRGITRADLAETLGVEDGVLRDVWDEVALPAPELAGRFLDWVLDPSLTWKYRKKLRRRNQNTKQQIVKNTWIKRVVWLPRDIADQLAAVSASVGYSEEAFIQLAVRRLLEHEPTMTTIKQAVEELEKLLIQRAINNNPNLWTLLKVEDYSTEVPKKTKNAEPLAPPTEVQQIAELPIFDGPASMIVEDTEWLEEI